MKYTKNTIFMIILILIISLCFAYLINKQQTFREGLTFHDKSQLNIFCQADFEQQFGNGKLEKMLTDGGVTAANNQSDMASKIKELYSKYKLFFAAEKTFCEGFIDFNNKRLSINSDLYSPQMQTEIFTSFFAMFFFFIYAQYTFQWNGFNQNSVSLAKTFDRLSLTHLMYSSVDNEINKTTKDPFIVEYTKLLNLYVSAVNAYKPLECSFDDFANAYITNDWWRGWKAATPRYKYDSVYDFCRQDNDTGRALATFTGYMWWVRYSQNKYFR